MTAVAAWGTVAALGPDRYHHGVAWFTVAACLLACGPAGLRWLRVAQREHYLAGSVSRFAARWWRVTPLNVALATVGVAAAVVSLWWPIAGVATAAVVAGGPVGLSLRGRTSALAWTRRLRTLAATWLLLELVVVAVGVLSGLAAPLALVAALLVPAVLDLACALTAPLERRLSEHFVDDAATRLARVAPTVVAITGSYGKTSTKGHLAHLLRPTRTVVATPASFNNRAGLARSINEHLADGTEVFVAEMGTYGIGEIADLCRWCPPALSMITAIGPVHLERFGSEDRIVEAKSEILRAAADVVLPIDDPRLAALADRAAAEGKRVLRCSSVRRDADVFVDRDDGGPRITVSIHGSVVAEHVEVPSGVQPTNLACAVAAALLLGVEPDVIGSRIADLPSVDHRLQAVRSSSGATIFDDTYNSNPAGAAEALAALAATEPVTSGGGDGSVDTGRPVGRLVVVTPGMVELGSEQSDANRAFATAIASVATDLLIVGRTNRRALLAGVAAAGGSALTVHRMEHREQAVAWVRAELGPEDAVLYENDLPDHYP